MKVISTELLLSAAHEAMFEQNENFETDIEHVIDFLQVMTDHSGFDVVRCKDCKHGQYEEWNNGECVDKTVYCDGYGIHKPDWFCADGERKDDG